MEEDSEVVVVEAVVTVDVGVEAVAGEVAGDEWEAGEGLEDGDGDVGGFGLGVTIVGVRGGEGDGVGAGCGVGVLRVLVGGGVAVPEVPEP